MIYFKQNSNTFQTSHLPVFFMFTFSRFLTLQAKLIPFAVSFEQISYNESLLDTFQHRYIRTHYILMLLKKQWYLRNHIRKLCSSLYKCHVSIRQIDLDIFSIIDIRGECFMSCLQFHSINRYFQHSVGSLM